MSEAAEIVTAHSKRLEALQEYYAVQTAIRDYDNRSFQIKSWSITIIAAAAAGGIAQQSPSLFALAALASLAFWLVDALWKSFQVVWVMRGAELERLLARSEFSYDGPGIHGAFTRRFKSPISWLYILPCMFKANVFLPHLPAALGLSVYYCELIGWSPAAALLGLQI